MSQNSTLAEVLVLSRGKLLPAPSEAAPRRRRGSARIEHLSREQLVAIFIEAKAARERDWILFLVTFWHGLRASEALSLTPEHFVDGYLTVQRLKGSLRTRQELISHENPLLNERAAVESWIKRHYEAGGTPTDRLFPISRSRFFRLVRLYGFLAGLPRHLCHPHIFKHSIAKESIAIAGIENVRQYLGHRSLSSTGAYLAVSDEAASRAVAKAWSEAKKGNNTGQQFTEMLPFGS